MAHVTSRLLSINPHQLGVIAAVVYGAIAGVICIFFILGGIFSPGNRIMIGVGIIAPFLYAGIAYLMTLIMASIFNWASAKTGGIEVTMMVEDKVA